MQVGQSRELDPRPCPHLPRAGIPRIKIPRGGEFLHTHSPVGNLRPITTQVLTPTSGLGIEVTRALTLMTGLQGIYMYNLFLIFLLRLYFKLNCLKLNFY